VTEHENPRDHRIITNLVIPALTKDGPTAFSLSSENLQNLTEIGLHPLVEHFKVISPSPYPLISLSLNINQGHPVRIVEFQLG